MSSTKPEPPPGQPAPARRGEPRPKWLRLYFALAAFDLLTVCLSLFLNHQIMGIYRASLDVNQAWANRLVAYDELRAFAADVNAPGNDVFDSRDVASESSRMHRARTIFDQKIAMARADLSRDAAASPQHALLQALDAVGAAMQEMCVEADLIFTYFAAGQAAEAGTRMATMDRKYAQLNTALAGVNAQVYAIQGANFTEQHGLASLLSKLEYLIACGILLMVGGATYYGHRVGQQVELAGALKLQSVRDHEIAVQAQAASRAKSEFLANMSHEIRTPMNGMLGLTEVLRNTPLNANQQSLLETLARSGDALLAIVNDILDFSKIEAGKLELEERDFDVLNSVEDVLKLFVPRAQAKQLNLDCRFDPRMCPATRGDAFRFRQVLTNLVGNAIKFTPSGSVSVDVSLAAPDRIRVSVIDTGIGIAAQHRQRLFSPFEQADSSTTRRFGGSGLGLAISRKLVEMMGGEIGVDGVEGQGSRFWFDMALVPVTSIPQVPHPGALTGRRVLVVDADPTNRMIFEHHMIAAGMRCTTAADGAEALQCLRHARGDALGFDAVLIDSVLPGVQGLELAAAMRAQLADLPLLLLTSSHSRAEMQRARSAGINAYLQKPVSRQDLYRALEACLRPLPPADLPIPLPKDAPRILGRVLLAEDNEVNQLVAGQMLAALGCKCDVVANGRQAVRAVQSGKHDIVLMDCQMPELDGYSATREIRAWEQAQPRRRHMPIVALTANALTGDADACRAAGMDDYLSKPYSREQLRGVLERWLPVQLLEQTLDPDSKVSTLFGPLEETELA